MFLPSLLRSSSAGKASWMALTPRLHLFYVSDLFTCGVQKAWTMADDDPVLPLWRCFGEQPRRAWDRRWFSRVTRSRQPIHRRVGQDQSGRCRKEKSFTEKTHRRSDAPLRSCAYHLRPDVDDAFRPDLRKRGFSSSLPKRHKRQKEKHRPVTCSPASPFPGERGFKRYLHLPHTEHKKRAPKDALFR